jgi:hypothetical protein
VNLATRELFLTWTDTFDQSCWFHVLSDLVLPRLIAYDGALVVHCGAVDSPAGAIGLIAPSGQGKSTLAGSLHARGFPLISDDAMILHSDGTGYRTERLYPSLRLFPDSLAHLMPEVDGTVPMADFTEKRRVPFVEGPMNAPLAALFRLADPSDDIRITSLTPAEACMAIIANSFALDASDPEETKRRFAQAAEGARNIPVYDLRYPRDYAALPEVHAAIFQAIGLSESAMSPV